uniref:Uncharacterized protein n=1 Tax=uncultured prokaryote TaxID=198431 RepID=A0A0H5QKX3_9ZZZZ|nr:hypothetical protein [uncultured prokaryote]
MYTIRKIFVIFFIILITPINSYAFLSFFDKDIHIVKNMKIDNDISIGDMLDNYKYFINTEWETKSGDVSRIKYVICSATGNAELLLKDIVQKNTRLLPQDEKYIQGLLKRLSIENNINIYEYMLNNYKKNGNNIILKFIFTLDKRINDIVGIAIKIPEYNITFNAFEANLPTGSDEDYENTPKTNFFYLYMAAIGVNQGICPILLNNITEYIEEMQKLNKTHDSDSKMTDDTYEISENSLESGDIENIKRKLDITVMLSKKNLSNRQIEEILNKEDIQNMNNINSINDIVLKLTKLISIQPASGEYIYISESLSGEMDINKQNNKIMININTIRNDGNGFCEFSGELKYDSSTGWYEAINLDDLEEHLSVIFLNNEAYIINSTRAWCGMNTYMDGQYIIKK